MSFVLRDDNSRYYGMYRAIVTDNDDPQRSGKVRVRVMPMFDTVSPDALPWAIMADPSMGGYADVGGSAIPRVDSHVWVFFEAGDHRFPVYFAGAPAIENDEPDLPRLSRSAESTVSDINSKAKTGIAGATGTWNEPGSAYAAKYPNNNVIRTKNGLVIELDDTDGAVRLHFYHPSGSREEIDNAGNRVQHTEGNRFSIVIGADKMYIEGDQSVVIGGNADVSIGGDSTVIVGGNSITTVGGNTALTSAGTTAVVSGGPVTITAPTIALN